MAWKVCTIIAIFMAGMEGVSSCKIDGVSVDGSGVIYATKAGWYAGFRPEVIVKAKTPFPRVLPDNGFSSIDAFSVAADGKTWFVSGSESLCVENDAVCSGMQKSTFPEAMLQAGFDRVDAFTIKPDGSFIVAKDGHYMEMRETTVITPKTAFPAILTDNGFLSIDSMAIHPRTGEFLFTLGSHYIVLDFSTESGKVVKPKTCLPAFMTTDGFNSVDGASFDGFGNIWVAKDGNYMGITPGSVVDPKTAFPESMVNAGFNQIDAMHIDPGTGNAYFAKGSEFLGVNMNGDIFLPKISFPAEMTAAGFDSVQGMSVTEEGNLCVAKDGEYMCVKIEDPVDGTLPATVTTPKAPFPAAMTAAGFNSIDGFFIDAHGTATVVQDGYYMQVRGDVVVTSKAALPATLTEALCGSDVCVGGLRLGDEGAPTTAMSDASTYEGGTLPPAPAPAPGFADTVSKIAAASDATSLVPSVVLLAFASLPST